MFGRRFLKEALPLVSSYFSGERVELSNISTPVGGSMDNESAEFANHIRFRHAIACCTEFLPIVQRIEGNLSSFNETVRTETKGTIRGRLDIPRYVSRRSTALSWPKSYPILTTTTTPQTPENFLIIRIFRTLLSRLSASQSPLKSAESTLARRYRNWILSRLKREPWVEISGTSSLARLYLEATHRVARRQTGNEYAYSALVQFLRDWRFVGNDLEGGGSSEKFVDALLSFPASDAFLDRIYEIWCIREIAQAILGIGGKPTSGPVPLTENRRQPIYTFLLDSDSIEIWFQHSIQSENAEWSYESTSSPLRGIPDISLIANGSHHLLVDAKNRLVTSNTRPEETYKMLGYFENFRSLLNTGSSWGVLAFISNDDFARSLISRNGRRLELIGAHPTSHTMCTFNQSITNILLKWINAWKGNG